MGCDTLGNAADNSPVDDRVVPRREILDATTTTTTRQEIVV